MKKATRFQDYNGERFQKDLIAGLVVGIVAIPLAMAFAMLLAFDRNMVFIQRLLPGFWSPYSEDPDSKSQVQQVRLFLFY